jgi:hypothetical protein
MSKEADDAIECGNCSAIIPDTATKCPECGVKLYGDEAGLELRQATSKQKGSQRKSAISRPRNLVTDDLTNENPDADEPRPVLIVDFNMPFLSIVGFMVKVAIASIPAMIILMIISGVLWAIFGGVLATLTSIF